MGRLGLRKYSSILFNGMEFSSKKCEFGRFGLREENDMRIFSELIQLAAVTHSLGQPSSRERRLCFGDHLCAMYVSKLLLWPVLSAAPRELSRHFAVS